MLRVVLRQGMQQGAAVMSQSCAVVISPFCIKADVHRGKDKSESQQVRKSASPKDYLLLRQDSFRLSVFTDFRSLLLFSQQIIINERTDIRSLG